MARRVFIVGLVLLGVCAVALSAQARPPVQEQVSSNLLVDGDFEAPPTWPMQDGIGEVQVAPGWRAYYLDKPPVYVRVPSNCSEHPAIYNCFWMRPEFRDNTSFANRIHSGQRSQKYFSYGRMHEAGLMQQVNGIPKDARVRFSIWIQAWMCSNPNACGKLGEHSDQPADMHLRVGIDPLGGTDPFTKSVVWSAEQPAWDKFVEFQVETEAISETVTVFTHSRADWEWARLNNDVYLDDAGLVIVGAYTKTLTTTLTVTATPTTTLTTTATPTPLPAGSITHTVRVGDTLFDVALEHGVQVTDLLRLNGITTSTELSVGQPLVVKIESVTPTATATPQPTPTPEPSATPPPTEPPSPPPAPTAALAATPAAATARPSVPLAAIVAVLVLGLVAVAVSIGVRRMRRKR